MKNKTVKAVLLSAVILGLASGCGSSKNMAQKNAETATETDTETETEAFKIEPVTVETVEDVKKVYQFDMEGIHYQLPCTIDDFLENGCTISDEELSYSIEAQKAVMVCVHPVPGENRYIEATVINESDQAQTVKECQKVVAITGTKGSNANLYINNGVKVSFDDAFLEDLQAIYSQNGKVYSVQKKSEKDCVWSWRFYRRVQPELMENTGSDTFEKGKILYAVLANVKNEDQTDIKLQRIGREQHEKTDRFIISIWNGNWNDRLRKQQSEQPGQYN